MLAKCFIIVVSVIAVSPLAQSENRILTSTVGLDTRTGKLVRRNVVSRAVHSETPPSDAPLLSDIIDSIAEKNEVEPPLVHSVIRAESNYNPLAVSNKGAQGLMQLIPATARRFGVNDSFNSTENVEGGVKYLKYLIDLFHGDYARAVAAYNAGEAAVTKYGGVPPYKETRNYVATVSRHLQAARRSYVPRVKGGESATAGNPASTAAETYSPVIASVNADGRVYYRTP